MPGITVVAEDGVTTLTIDRVEKKNALTAAMYTQLADALDAAADDDAVRVALIRGHASVFSAGNDLADFLHEPPIGLDSPVIRFLRALVRFPKPLVAAVAGPAVGVGTTMLLHCDLVYAADTAVLSLPFVDLGLVPEAASSLLLPERIGHVRAAAMLLLGERMDAATALAAGLVNRVVPVADLDALAHDQARRLAAKPLPSLLETKRLLRGGDRDAVLARIDEEAAVFGRLLHEPAAQAAFAAFLGRG